MIIAVDWKYLDFGSGAAYALRLPSFLEHTIQALEAQPSRYHYTGYGYRGEEFYTGILHEGAYQDTA